MDRDLAVLLQEHDRAEAPRESGDVADDPDGSWGGGSPPPPENVPWAAGLGG